MKPLHSLSVDKRFATTLLLGVCLWLWTSALQAQISTTIGSVVKGFSVPQHNESGELISKIAGTEANTVSPNRAVIKELVMEFYNKGVVSMKVTSPRCDYWFLQSRINTREGVKIERENMTITAQNFQWEEKNKKGVLQKNVVVTLENFILSPTANIPTSSLPPPAPPISSSLPSLDLTPKKDPESTLQLESAAPQRATPQENKKP